MVRLSATRSCGMASEQRPLVEGVAAGRILVLDEPLSFWGGIDPASGLVVDTHHPQQGESVTGKILVMPYGRGSSSSSQVLTEALRLGTGPAGIVLRQADSIITLGSLVAGFLYDIDCPVLVMGEPAYSLLRTGLEAEIEAGRLQFG